MKVFFTSENESVSKHSLDTLDSRKKKTKKTLSSKWQARIQYITTKCSRATEPRGDGEWKGTTEPDVTSYLEDKLTAKTSLHLHWIIQTGAGQINKKKQESVRMYAHTQLRCAYGGVCVCTHTGSSRTLWIKCRGDETMRPLYANPLTKSRAKATLSIPTCI